MWCMRAGAGVISPMTSPREGWRGDRHRELRDGIETPALVDAGPGVLRRIGRASFLVVREVHLVGVHVDDAVKQTEPPVAAWLVGELLLDEPADHRGVEVHAGRVGDAQAAEPGAQPLDHL